MRHEHGVETVLTCAVVEVWRALILEVISYFRGAFVRLCLINDGMTHNFIDGLLIHRIDSPLHV